MGKMLMYSFISIFFAVIVFLISKEIYLMILTAIASTLQQIMMEVCELNDRRDK